MTIRLFCVLVVSSRMVAERFNKEHRTVLRSINSLHCSDSFTDLNFEVSTYKDASGKTNIEYLITRDGFSFLVMGFTGGEAGYWKERYIKAFNDMEAELNRPKLPTTFAEALRLAATQAEQLEAARPKVEFVDTYVEKGDCVCLRELGKKLGKRDQEGVVN